MMASCIECKQELIFKDKPDGPEDGSLTVPGQVYSESGRRELKFSGMCEHCFDKATFYEDSPIYYCCEHCLTFGRRFTDGRIDDNHEWHEIPCYTQDCPGGEQK